MLFSCTGFLIISNSSKMSVYFNVELDCFKIFQSSNNAQIALIPYGTMDTIIAWFRFIQNPGETDITKVIATFDVENIGQKTRLIFEGKMSDLIQLEQQLRGKLIYFRKPLFKVLETLDNQIFLIGIDGTEQKFVEKAAAFPLNAQDIPRMNRLFQIRQENEILSLLRNKPHQYIIKPYELSTNGSSFSIIFEHFKGEDLYKFLIKNPNLTSAYTRQILQNILQGVSHIHSANIIHRDLKLQNIFMRTTLDPANIVIGDFGLACQFSDLQARISKCGTPGFMAPEVYYQNQLYDFKVDIYSVGVIFYFLLAKINPFLGKNNKETSEKQQNGQYNEEPLASIKAADYHAYSLLKSMLQINSAMRPSAQECLNHPYFFTSSDTNSTSPLNDDHQIIKVNQVKHKIMP